MSGYESVSAIDIAADRETVWAALTDNARLGEAMFGTQVDTDWRVGSSITYSGEFEGMSFEDHGEVIELSRPSVLRITHASAGSDVHELRFDLAPTTAGTHVTLTQDNNPTEEAAEHSRGNWDTMLGLLKVVEG